MQESSETPEERGDRHNKKSNNRQKDTVKDCLVGEPEMEDEAEQRGNEGTAKDYVVIQGRDLLYVYNNNSIVSEGAI